VPFPHLFVRYVRHDSGSRNIKCLHRNIMIHVKNFISSKELDFANETRSEVAII